MIINTGDEFTSDWPYALFKKAYEDLKEGSVLKCATIIHSESEPDNVAPIVVRIFIQNGAQMKGCQKYIIGLRFFNFGEMATLDIISLKQPNHKSIVMEHARRMGWSRSEHLQDENYRESYLVPMIASGASLKVTPDGKLIPSSESMDYKGRLFDYNINDITGRIAYYCNMGEETSSVDSDFLSKLVDFMHANKGHELFYERLIEHFPPRQITGQNISAIVLMKVVDRSIKEPDTNVIKLHTHEMTDGFAKKLLAYIVADQVRSK